MSPAIRFENAIVEVLDAQAEPRDTEFLERFQFMLLQRARFALEGDLLGAPPRHDGLQLLEESTKLSRAQERRSAAAEIDELERAAADDRLGRVQLDLANQGVEVGLDVAGVLVGVDAKIAELAAF